MKIKDLPPRLKELALANQKLQGRKLNEDAELREAKDSFSWGLTTEGNNFWFEINKGKVPSEYLTPVSVEEPKPKEMPEMPSNSLKVESKEEMPTIYAKERSSFEILRDETKQDHPKYEYLIMEEPTDKVRIVWLNELGSQGWKCYAVNFTKTTVDTYYFIRPI